MQKQIYLDYSLLHAAEDTVEKFRLYGNIGVGKIWLRYPSCNLSGHDGTVTQGSWSQDSKWLVSCSEDRTAHVWSVGLTDPVLTMHTTNHNFAADKEGAAKPDKVGIFTGSARKYSLTYQFCSFQVVSQTILSSCIWFESVALHSAYLIELYYVFD